MHPAIDLSADGIYVLARDQRKAVDGEEELNLEFTLPNGDTVKTRGQVVHVDDHGEQRGMRIAFRHMTAQMRDTIDTFVKRTLSESQSG